MKKTFIVGALVALAITLTSCMNGLVADPVAFKIKYTKEKQYAAPSVDVKADWASVAVLLDCDEATLGKVQFALTTDKEAGPASWDPNTMTYVTNYVQFPKGDDGKFKNLAVLNLADELAKKDNENKSSKDRGATKYTKLALQITTSEAEDLEVSVKGIIVTKTDGFQESVKLTGDWGSSIE